MGITQAWTHSLCLNPGSATELSGQVNFFVSLLCEFSPLDSGESLRWDHCKLERFSHASAPGCVLMTDPYRPSYSFALCLIVSLRPELVHVTKLVELN